MNEIQQFLYEKSVEPYGIGMLNSNDAIELISLFEKNGLPIHGFDGFHKRTDRSRSAIEIDQDFSADYSNFEIKEAYKLALEYFQAHISDNMLYEIAYESMASDYEVVRSYKEREKITDDRTFA